MTNSNVQKLLFVDYGLNDQESELEAKAIEAICGLVDVAFERQDVADPSAFKKCLDSSSDTKFDYLYLAAHGNDEYFEGKNGVGQYRWADFAIDNCNSPAFKESSAFYLGCCHGGSKAIAQILFYHCNRFRFVAGLACSTFSHEIALAFHGFLIAHKQRNSGALISNRVTAVVQQSFQAHDRSEMYAELASLRVAGSYTYTNEKHLTYPVYLEDGFYTLDELENRRQNSTPVQLAIAAE